MKGRIGQSGVRRRRTAVTSAERFDEAALLDLVAAPRKERRHSGRVDILDVTSPVSAVYEIRARWLSSFWRGGYWHYRVRFSLTPDGRAVGTCRGPLWGIYLMLCIAGLFLGMMATFPFHKPDVPAESYYGTCPFIGLFLVLAVGGLVAVRRYEPRLAAMAFKALSYWLLDRKCASLKERATDPTQVERAVPCQGKPDVMSSRDTEAGEES